MTTKALDALGVAITNAGYTWTPEMRSAYEKGIRESEWVGLTDEEVESWRGNYDFFDSALVRKVEAKLKEKNSVL